MKKFITPTLVLLILALLGTQFCVKPPDYPKDPVIEFLGLSKNVLQQGKAKGDSLSIIFS
jgi:hypothetical protein